MRFFLVRHGCDDFHAQSASAGLQQSHAAAQSIAGYSQEDAEYQIYASPVSRAVHTANVLSDDLGVYYVHQCPWLVESARVKDFKEGLGGLKPGDRDLIFVTHKPLIDSVVLSYGRRFGVKTSLGIGVGDVVCIDDDMRTVDKL